MYIILNQVKFLPTLQNKTLQGVAISNIPVFKMSLK